MKSYIHKSFVQAFLTGLYIAIVAWVMFHAQFLFGKVTNFLAPLLILLLLVISATVTSLLVLGKPIQMYLEGAKKEAVQLLVATVVWLALFAVIIVISVSLK